MAATPADTVVAQGRGRPGGNPQYSKGYEEGYREAYRRAYREGYSDARVNRRFDDSDYSDGYDNDDYGNDPRFQRWRSRYTQAYTYTDDSFYRDCRTSVDPGGVIAGALIGGLLGNAIGRGGGRTGATVAGVIGRRGSDEGPHLRRQKLRLQDLL